MPTTQTTQKRSKTSIGWTDYTWNFAVGCTVVSEGCEDCYARVLHNRFHQGYLNHKGRDQVTGRRLPRQFKKRFEEVQFLPERLSIPGDIKAPSMFFVNSMSDLFHPDLTDEQIQQGWQAMLDCPRHLYQILTKRILSKKYKDLEPRLSWAEHIWLGVSIELDKYCNRAEALKRSPAAVKFLSLEPLLGPLPSLDLEGIDWVIVGCESGRYARPMDLSWVRPIRDQCITLGVPFFFKQTLDSRGYKNEEPELDGRTWKQYPEAAKKLMEEGGLWSL